MAEKIIITGGPHTGKTTLLEGLKLEFPDAYFVPEPATNVINREQEAQRANPGYEPRLPWIDYRQFGPLVADESEILEAGIPESTRLAFQDRSLIDTIAYSRVEGFHEFVPELQRRIQLARYNLAFFCQPVGDYELTSVRRELPKKAAQTHSEIRRAYEESGLDVVEIPSVSVSRRIDLITKVLQLRNLTT
jgi:predicted ATPase